MATKRIVNMSSKYARHSSNASSNSSSSEIPLNKKQYTTNSKHYFDIFENSTDGDSDSSVPHKAKNNTPHIDSVFRPLEMISKRAESENDVPTWAKTIIRRTLQPTLKNHYYQENR